MTSPPHAHTRALHHLIGGLARAEPGRVALREGDRVVTFGELWERTGQVASLLLQEGVKPGEVVAVALPRSIDLVVACFAVLRAGGIAWALDLRVPTPRNQRLLAVAGARWSIVRGPGVPECVSDTVAVDVRASGSGVEGRDPEVGALDHAFLVFTSGSSGEPKGVLLAHGAMVARSMAEQAASEFTREDLFLLRASPAFIFFPVALEILASGVPLLIASDDIGEDAGRLAELIRQYHVTFVGFPPRLIASLVGLSEAASSLASLRILRSAGESLPPGVATRFRLILPMCRLVDGYGTTEAGGVITTADVVDADGESPGFAGTPLPGITLRLVAEDGASSTEGEIWVASPMLATGYWGGEIGDDPKFVEEPGSQGTALRRWYRTGDRGRLTSDGRLLVLGRLDLQLNVDGLRVDPVEIEDAFRLHESVADAAVWTHRSAEGRSRLVAYIVDHGPPAPAAILRSFLGRRLPQALIPVRFVRLPALPLTPSGKVNRAALPAPEIREHPSREPRNDTETKLLALFRDVLGAPEMGVNDDFFEWGGDSLKAFDLMTRLFEVTGAKIPGAAILDAPTVEDLAREVARGDHAQVSTVWLRRTGSLPPLVCLPGLAADPLWMFPLIAALDPSQPLLGLSFVGLKPPFTILEAASRGLEALRAVQPRGPYFLLGHSLGGVLAFEMARELVGSGEDVAFLGLLDTFVPGSLRSRGPAPNPAQRLRSWRKQMIRGTKERLRRILSFVGLVKKSPAPLFLPGFRTAVRDHRILPCDLAVTLFRARERGVASDLATDWAPLARRGVEAIDIPGHHLNVLTGGRANELSARIAEAVAGASTQRRPPGSPSTSWPRESSSPSP